ncbi:hypothetical protein IAI10_16000 [Clostridium sp. 19966]|uniref:hypothetical protein n=1 Tax=Clostridium sp. 19966 TaxID=2768166 RepID=UPI0028DFA008|nr:hypothetical protein [Clostridium sp. 19966]MDT8718170.1 hypothetical protein [Clostridium sp. 19966]
MSKLNICIDIDGTITDPYYWLELANSYFNKNVTEEQVTRYYVHEVMGVERIEYEEFYEKNKFKIHTEEKLRRDVRPILNILNTMHNIYFVTARDKELEMLTHLYLRRYGIEYDGLFVLGSSYKVDKANELNCNLFIEDNYDNAIQLSENGTKVVLLDTYYNRKPLNKNITRVYGWKEIYLIIKELSLQNKIV